MYLGTDYDVSHIEALWDLGYLPIKVKAIKEGTFVPYGVPVLTIVNTYPEFFWLTNFLETMISNMLWMPMTAATTAYSYKQTLTKACLETDKEAIDFVDFQGQS
jgi:nicotinamide phosphoribosyltransferase